jgi:hypothetical protein
VPAARSRANARFKQTQLIFGIWVVARSPVAVSHRAVLSGRPQICSPLNVSRPRQAPPSSPSLLSGAPQPTSSNTHAEQAFSAVTGWRDATDESGYPPRISRNGGQSLIGVAPIFGFAPSRQSTLAQTSSGTVTRTAGHRWFSVAEHCDDGAPDYVVLPVDLLLCWATIRVSKNPGRSGRL